MAAPTRAPLRLHWFLPTSGDSRSLVGAGQGVPGEVRGGLRETLGHGFREPSIDYLADVARTAEKLGFEGVLTPTGTFCEDAWLTTAALVRETSRLKFLVAFRPGVINPVLAAQMAAAYQRISGGRLMVNIVTGGEPREQARFGDTAPKAERYAKTDEFLAVVRGAWHDAPFDFTGQHFSVEGAMVSGGIDAGAGHLLRRVVRTGRARRGPARGRLPDLGRAAGAGPRRRSRGCAGSPRPRAAPCASGCGSTRCRATPPRRRGGTPSGCSTASTRPRSPRRRPRSTRASRPGRPRMLAAARRPLVVRRRARARGRAEPVVGRRPGPGRRRHRAGRQPRGGRRPDRGVPRARHRRAHPVRLPARRGGLVVRRGRDAGARATRPARRVRRDPGGRLRVTPHAPGVAPAPRCVRCATLGAWTT